MWKVRVFVEKHDCVPNGECEMLKVPQITRLFVDKVREDPEYYMSMKIEEQIKDSWKISVSRCQCQSARNKALRWIEAEYDNQFARLRDYATELRQSNPDLTIYIETMTNAEGKEEFDKLYVCFDALRRAWKGTCRPLIGKDGCFLKHKVKGQVLVALGRDADNAIYPIAWGVVQVENTDNWLWFVKNVKEDLGMNDGDGYILGLISAVKKELPRIAHRICVRHIYANLKKIHGSKKDMKPLIWNLAWSYNRPKFEERLDRIFNYNSGVWNDIKNTDPKSWCIVFYKIGNCCEDVENNSTESFNSTINKAREKLFVPMLETIRRLAMVRTAGRDYLCTPYVVKFLAEEHKKAVECRVTVSTNGNYEARLSGCAYRINLERRTCTCMKFQICGIPCEHAYGVILAKKLTPEHYVSHWFTTETWRKTYSEGLVPVRGARFWPETDYPNVHVPPPPPQPGRKKITKTDKKRKRGVNESPTKKQPMNKKRIMHYGVCGVANHNSRFHAKEQQSQGSQAELSQGIVSQSKSSQAMSLI